MSLMDIFTENVNSRVLAAVFALTSVVGLEGCSATLAQRVVTDSVVRGTYPARRAAASELSNIVIAPLRGAVRQGTDSLKGRPAPRSDCNYYRCDDAPYQR